MRLLVLAALAATSAVAVGLPTPGVYCPIGTDAPAISVDGASIGIDLLDCQSPRVAGRRLRAKRCFANGGSEISYDTDLVILPGGDLQHDGVRFQRRDRGCAPKPGPRRLPGSEP